MYIHWSHHYLPKTFGLLSFVFNPVFIGLLLTEHKSIIGNYRYLLVFFAFFDMIYSTVELFVPVAIHGAGSAFVIYLTDGPFFDKLDLGQFAISFRCGFISLSYGLLVIHFLYRYIVLFNSQIIETLTKPKNMVFVFLFFASHGIVWSGVCEIFLYADDEVRNYIRDVFNTTYNVDSHKIPMLTALYTDATWSLRQRSWTGISILTCISVYAISLYIVFSYKIISKLRNNPALSEITRHLHQQLLKALLVQTFIPIFISFLPCLAAWYAPVFNIDFGKWNNYLGVIALSAFPFLDPLAIIVLLPSYRNRILNIFKKPSSSSSTSFTPSNRRIHDSINHHVVKISAF